MIDKRITPRFMAYEKVDPWIGIVMVIIGAVAMMAFCSATFAGRPRRASSPTQAASLATAYALSDVLSLKHLLHRGAGDARGFCLVYSGLITEAVQTLAGLLLPSATVFLLLCNDRAVLGPWVNGRWTNLFTGSVIAILVMLSIILTASVLYPTITGGQILLVLGGGSVFALVAGGITLGLREPSPPAMNPVPRPT